nr:hypothetical protein B11C_10004 [Bartonella sp. 1-1C]
MLLIYHDLRKNYIINHGNYSFYANFDGFCHRRIAETVFIFTGSDCKYSFVCFQKHKFERIFYLIV